MTTRVWWVGWGGLGGVEPAFSKTHCRTWSKRIHASMLVPYRIHFSGKEDDSESLWTQPLYALTHMNALGANREPIGGPKQIIGKMGQKLCLLHMAIERVWTRQKMTSTQIAHLFGPWVWTIPFHKMVTSWIYIICVMSRYRNRPSESSLLSNVSS